MQDIVKAYFLLSLSDGLQHYFGNIANNIGIYTDPVFSIGEKREENNEKIKNENTKIQLALGMVRSIFDQKKLTLPEKELLKKLISFYKRFYPNYDYQIDWIAIENPLFLALTCCLIHIENQIKTEKKIIIFQNNDNHLKIDYILSSPSKEFKNFLFSAGLNYREEKSSLIISGE